jgi:cyclopropane-fatty-acyl-phospholipid synthase
MSPLRYRMLDAALAAGLAPDGLLRAGSRYGAGRRERLEGRGGVAAQDERLRELLARMRTGPVAEIPQAANRQHYELPPEFFQAFLGPRRKYSGCVWPAGADTLAAAEDATLALYCQRAGIRDGMRILDLGCGWGSLSIWLAERYPAADVLAVSNSASQRRLIEEERDRFGLDNLRILTADVNEFVAPGRFDRVVSIEMFEHMRNWRELLRRIRGWLTDDGQLFLQVFSHRRLPYLFQGTWAAERFFTAGLMPSHEMVARFQEDMLLQDSWAIPGTEYARTLEAWLNRLDAHRERALEALRRSGLSAREARATLARWRLFLLSTQVMWGYGGGDHWLVSHHLMSPHTARRNDGARAPAAVRRVGSETVGVAGEG